MDGCENRMRGRRRRLAKRSSHLLGDFLAGHQVRRRLGRSSNEDEDDSNSGRPLSRRKRRAPQRAAIIASEPAGPTGGSGQLRAA